METERDADLPAVLEALGYTPGVEVSDDFPTPIEVAGEDGTYVGRVRVEERVIQYWCVADNLLKGAATNAVQIAESLAASPRGRKDRWSVEPFWSTWPDSRESVAAGGYSGPSCTGTFSVIPITSLRYATPENFSRSAILKSWPCPKAGFQFGF